MLYIRTDSNNNIATGHVMRCLSIAKALAMKGEECIFITADNYSDELINSNGFETICLNSRWSELDEELELLIKLIKEKKIVKLLVDSYSVTENYLSTLKKYTKLIYIDDINLFKYQVDMLINYSGSYKKFGYEFKYNALETRLLLGYKYIPLREEFQNVKPMLRENVKQVLFTMGGTDENNITAEFIENIIKNRNYDKLKFHVIIGRFNNNLDKLTKLAEGYSNIEIYYNAKNMAELMKKCDIAISAGGTTLLELCACGVPTISFTIADNQKEGTKCLVDEEAIIYAGDIRDDKSLCMKSIFKNIDLLIKDFEFRCKLSKTMNSLIDGNGASNIAEEIKMLQH